MDARIHFGFIYGEVKGMYVEEWGKSGVDPVAIVKCIRMQPKQKMELEYEACQRARNSLKHTGVDANEG